MVAAVKRQWWEPKPAVDGRSTDLDRPFDYTHDDLGDALDQLDALSADWIALRARCARLEGALNQIACWDEGPVVTGSFDDPANATIAREALAEAGARGAVGSEGTVGEG